MTIVPGRPAYLKPNVLLEPLVDQWYAWPHLISPMTAARNICHRHLPIMDSYVKAPGVHAAAVANPKLLGGPFMDYPEPRTEQIAALRDRTRTHCAALIELSEAIDVLTAMIRRAEGASLEPLYAELPTALRGCVELVYDRVHRADFRVFERLLYRAPFHDLGRQSVLLSCIEDDARPFILSTPRLPGPQDLHLRMPFSSPGLDALFAAQRSAVEIATLAHALAIPEHLAGSFAALFTHEPPPPRPAFTGPGVRCRYFGHACVLVESPETSVLIDPLVAPVTGEAPPRYTYEDLPETIGTVLITHNHQDHVMLETLLRLRHRIGQILVPRARVGSLLDPSLRLILESVGFERVIEIDPLEDTAIEGGSITALPFLGEHGDLDIASKAAWLVDLSGRRVLFAADSRNIDPELHRRVHAQLGPVDLLFIGMECDGAPVSWIYGPLLGDRLDRRFDHGRALSGSEHVQALELAASAGAKRCFVYAMGQEPWLGFITAKHYTDDSLPIVESNRFVAECRHRGWEAERLYGRRELMV